ncbi:hypothetical protein F4813DRAFT_394755 [Daldinia decipiens]|uniref:uncharacterized protein n=1 Tax=Daldinia decipiens TaxID=326647 RepID=UPI0020C21B5B|nr:uncharacterized protein F4813DRAFT_394755 [Daldinia decipiens]KAI1652382.1 hypothetical protein F4813DRAFT_394755 [Daldinia decipiens]
MTEAYGELPVELRILARDDPKKVKRMADNSKAYIAMHKGALESMEELLGWTSANKAQVGQGQIGTQASLPKSNERYITMWKKICRLRRVFPPSIMSPVRYLEYDATARVQLSDGKTKPDLVWLSSFCESLSRLALGGSWGDSMELLAAFDNDQPTNMTDMDFYESDGEGTRIYFNNADEEVRDGSDDHATTSRMYRDINSDSDSVIVRVIVSSPLGG